MQLTYKQVGNFFIPEIKNDKTEKSSIIGKFGEIKGKYLMDKNPAKFNGMLLSNELIPYLQEVDNQAKIKMELIVSQTMKKQGITEELKAADQMAWVQAINNIKSQTEALVISEL